MTDTPRCEPDDVRRLLGYDPETGRFWWNYRVGARASDNTRRAGKNAGWQDEGGYVRIELNGRTYKAHRLAWVLMTGAWPDLPIDHINGVCHDNRWQNLRIATFSQNQQNRGKPKSNTSGFKGVSFDPRSKTWRAVIGKSRRQKHLGTFATAEDASEAYQQAVKVTHGDFAYGAAKNV